MANLGGTYTSFRRERQTLRRCAGTATLHAMTSDVLAQLGVATGVAAASGLRLYGTVAALGLLHHLGALRLPGALDVLGHPAVIALAAALYVAEFIADKVPAFDSLWDALHTFIRIPAAAILGFALLSDVQEPWRTAAALLTGAVALSTHGLKASTRLAVNTSPEPFTNWGLSLSEDVAWVGILWLLVEHPWVALLLGLALLVFAGVVAGWIVRGLRRLTRRRAPAPGRA